MKKEDILEQIESLFYEKSYQEVSLQDIADIFSIKKSSLYHYFNSKEHLFYELLEYSFIKYLTFIKRLIEKWDDTNFQKLLSDFINYGDRTKNIFFHIHQNTFPNNTDLHIFIQKKQKIIFDTIHRSFHQRAGFSREKTFIFLVVIPQVFKKDGTYETYQLDIKKIYNEIETLFFNTL